MLSKTETYGGCAENAKQEPQTACGAMVAGGTRERRENPTHISDLNRAVDKHLGDIPKTNPELKYLFYTAKSEPTKASVTQPLLKNTPGSLKQLRWSIYEVIECYEGDYGKTISGCLKQAVEQLFQEYTHS